MLMKTINLLKIYIYKSPNNDQISNEENQEIYNIFKENIEECSEEKIKNTIISKENNDMKERESMEEDENKEPEKDDDESKSILSCTNKPKKEESSLKKDLEISDQNKINESDNDVSMDEYENNSYKNSGSEKEDKSINENETKTKKNNYQTKTKIRYPKNPRRLVYLFTIPKTEIYNKFIKLYENDPNIFDLLVTRSYVYHIYLKKAKKDKNNYSKFRKYIIDDTKLNRARLKNYIYDKGEDVILDKILLLNNYVMKILNNNIRID